MRKNLSSTRRFIYFSLSSFIVYGTSTFSAYSQQMPTMKKDTLVVEKKNMKVMSNMEMLPMPFFTHMGMPMDVGVYNLRIAALPTQNVGKTNTEYDVQFMTGLSKTVGLHLEGRGTFRNPTLEAMVQFLVWKSKNGMNAISPIIEFEFPLGKEATRRVYTLVGFSSTLSNSRLAFNQVLHYSPLEDLAEGSISLVYKISNRIFLVSELSGVFQKDELPISNLLGGVKIKLNKNFIIGIGYQQPITTNEDFSSQYIFQPDVQWNR